MGRRIAKPSRYDEDFYAWANDQALMLRSRQTEAADLDQIAEELETLGRSERRALQSSLKLIVLHMLKLKFQPDKATPSWRTTITRERQNVDDALEDMPSLKAQLPGLFEKAYRDGRRLAISETGLPEAAFPIGQVFTLDQLRDDAFLPTVPDLREGSAVTPRSDGEA